MACYDRVYNKHYDDLPCLSLNLGEEFLVVNLNKVLLANTFELEYQNTLSDLRLKTQVSATDIGTENGIDGQSSNSGLVVVS